MEPLFVKTPWGLAYRTVSQAERTVFSLEFGGLSHRDAALETFAEIGFPLEYELNFLDSDVGTIRQLLDDSLARFDGETDLEWSIISYCHYLPTGRKWTNRHGENFDMSLLVDRLVSRSNSKSACFRTHRIIALAHIWNTRFLTKESQSHQWLENHLMELSDILTNTQLTNGSWNNDYLKGKLSDLPPQQTLNESEIAFSVTSHLLEYFSLLQDSLRPSKSCIERSLSFFFAALNDPIYGAFERNLSSTCHGVRAAFYLSSDDKED
jgi:hypothetical protein